MVKNVLPSHAVQNNCAFISLLTHNILFLQRICRKIVALRELHTIQKKQDIIMSHQKQALDLNEALATSEAFLIKYRKWVIGVGIAVVVLIGAWVGGYYYLKSQNEQGQYEISLGEQYVQTGDWNKAIKGDGATFKGYEKIARNYAWTDAANLAHFYCGLGYFNLGDYKKAIAELEDFSPKGDVTVSANALAALGNAYVADKQLDKGVKYLKKAADHADNAALSPIYLLEAGQVLESQGKKAEAHELYVSIKSDYPESQLAQTGVQNGKVIGAEIDKYIERTK